MVVGERGGTHMLRMECAMSSMGEQRKNAFIWWWLGIAAHECTESADNERRLLSRTLGSTRPTHERRRPLPGVVLKSFEIRMYEQQVY